MRPLSLDSANYANSLLQQGYDAHTTTNAVNQLRPGRTPYQVDDIRQFRQNGALNGLPQRNTAQPGPSRVPSAVSQAAIPLTISQQIAQLEGQRSSLANMGGDIDRQIAQLQNQLLNPAPQLQSAPAGSGASVSSTLTHYSQADLTRALIERRNPQDFSGAPLPSGHSVDSRATESTHDSRYSDASGQHPPSSLASSSRAPVTVTNSSREVSQMAAAPYSVSSQRSGSSTTTVTPIHCKHTPGGVVNTDTFVGCDVTDDELTRSDKIAKRRVAKRRIRYQQAQELGVTTTGAAQQAEKDARAAAKGFASRQEARQAGEDARAAAKGFASRQEARQAEKDARAAAKGFASRQEARQAGDDARAAAKGFASRQEADLAEEDARAARQLGPEATRSDLLKIRAGERALAQQEGVPVGKIRSRRLQANPAASPPSVDPSMTRTTVALANREEASTRSWNIGDRFTIPLQNGQTRLFEVRRNRHGGEPIYQKDFQEILRGG